MRRQIVPAVKAFVVLTVLLGLVYPLAMTGAAQVLFHSKADGSFIKDGSGKVVGSSLLGQQFTGRRYFHPRASAAGDGYDPLATAASNLGPTNPDLAKAVRARAVAYRAENHLSPGTRLPVDAVTASGSGLDPDISVANARLQAARVAAARGLTTAQVLKLVDENTDGRSLGFLGEPGVNVLKLNLALDKAAQS